MNIEEIKEARDQFIEVNKYILELANNQFSGLTLQARIKHDKFMQGFDNLLSIIETTEQALSYIAYSENITAMNATAEEALQAIRGK